MLNQPTNSGNIQLLDKLKSINYSLAESSFSHFIKTAWTVLEPSTQYRHNWHIDLLSEYLEAVYSGQIKRLIINEPPRELKSIQCTVCFPAWVWLKNPSVRFITASYSASLAIKHSVDRRLLIDSHWYQTMWGKRFKLRSDQNQKSEFENDHRGSMVATSVGGTIIGKGMNIGILDDPLNPMQAASDVERERANTWIDQSFMTRFNDNKTGSAILVMQRLHELDPTGHLLEKGGWEHLCLPAQAPARVVVKFPISNRQIIREEGDCLNPARNGPEELARAKVDLGSSGFQAQMQQDPRPGEGGFFKREWWKRYRELPKDIIQICTFADCANKPGVSNDWTVMATWAETKSGYYLIKLWRKKVSYPDLFRGATDNYFAHRPNAFVIEDTVNGVALIQDLKSKTTIPVIAWRPEGDKFVRATRAQPMVEAGNCYLPIEDPEMEAFIEEGEMFPNAAHDDCVDTLSMMCDYFRQMKPEPSIRFL